MVHVSFIWYTEFLNLLKSPYEEDQVDRRKMEGMNQFGLQYICTRKCHYETPCIVILNKQKMFLYQKRGQEDK
jgi:hypothetical protein